MKRVYMHSDKPNAMEGYYRVHSSLFPEGPIRVPFLRRLREERYLIDFEERLNPGKLLFRDAESILVRPRTDDEYLSIENSDGPFIEYQRMEGSPLHDPESECPNEWEILEALEHISLSDFPVAALRFTVSGHSYLTPEESAEALRSGLECPCRTGGRFDNSCIEAAASIVYFSERPRGGGTTIMA